MGPWGYPSLCTRAPRFHDIRGLVLCGRVTDEENRSRGVKDPWVSIDPWSKCSVVVLKTGNTLRPPPMISDGGRGPVDYTITGHLPPH